MYVICHAHAPAKAIGRNEMLVVLSNGVLDRGPGLPMEGDIWGVGTPSLQ